MRRVDVTAGGRTYGVVIGSGALGCDEFPPLSARADGTGFIVSRRVMELQGIRIAGLVERSVSPHIFPMDDGEDQKSYHHAEEYFNLLLKSGFSRKSLLVGVGGGVVGDFTGYCAAGYMRGIGLVHIPTTLLAMVDSSIGGKTAVNIEAGKNIVGAFHQPALVIADVDFLRTLPWEEMKNGMAETVKHAFIGEGRLLDLLRSHDPTTVRGADVMEELIYLSAGFKASVVGKDERESGLRAILNFGHTVGHAIESFLNFRGISHGEAVARGMKAELEISRRLGLIKGDEAALCREIVSRYGLAEEEMRLDVEGVLEHMKFDKKNYGGSLRFALLRGIGDPVFDQEVKPGLLREVLQIL